MSEFTSLRHPLPICIKICSEARRQQRWCLQPNVQLRSDIAASFGFCASVLKLRVLLSWMGSARVSIVGVLAYMALVLVLRISGKRTLSKMDMFDLVVTVAPGSTLASLVPSKNDALAEGLLAFATLIGLQFVVA